jgi:cytochrome bd-type quinol oxidase subunit 2
MTKIELIKLEVKLRKAYRSAFFCGVLVVMAMVSIVMVSMIAGQPVDQKAVAQDWTPLIMLMAVIAGSCQFLHAGVKDKIRKLEQ